MIFKRASDDDIPQLVELIQTCYRGDVAKKGWTYESDLVDGIRTTEDFVKEDLKAPGGSYLKHTNDEGKIVGCVYTKIIPEESKVFVGCLCVYPTLQSQGLGKKLMAAAEDIAKNANCVKMCMKVLTVRKDLIVWYERLGYKYIGEVSPFPEGNGTPKVPLELGSWEKHLH